MEGQTFYHARICKGVSPLLLAKSKKTTFAGCSDVTSGMEAECPHSLICSLNRGLRAPLWLAFISPAPPSPLVFLHRNLIYSLHRMNRRLLAKLLELSKKLFYFWGISRWREHHACCHLSFKGLVCFIRNFKKSHIDLSLSYRNSSHSQHDLKNSLSPLLSVYEHTWWTRCMGENKEVKGGKQRNIYILSKLFYGELMTVFLSSCVSFKLIFIW